MLAARTTAAGREDVASRQKKRNLQIRGAMDGVRDELERPSRQTLSAGARQLCGGVQQQGAQCGGGGHSLANATPKMVTLVS